jgi:Fe-S oxidoreductase
MHRWARLASHVPWAANFATQTTPLRELAKTRDRYCAGTTHSSVRATHLPALVRASSRRNTGATPVILWPDTWNNYFLPETAQAAVEVLEAAGFDVLLPSRPLCCGRPLYDYGMLRIAKQLLRGVLNDARSAHPRWYEYRGARAELRVRVFATSS